VLRKTGLAAPDAARLRLLAPVREVLRRLRPPQSEDHERLVAHFLELARLGDRVGKGGGAEAARRLETELANLEEILTDALEATDPEAAIRAALDLGEFERFTGIGGPSLLDQATAAAARAGSVFLEARCFRARADLALARSDHDGARLRYEEALPLFRRVGSVLGEANCIQSLGDIALRRSDHDGARSRYEEALPLFRRVGSVLGEANCVLGLGDLAAATEETETARQLIGKALELYERIAEPYSVGLAHQRLAKIVADAASRREHLEAARQAWSGIGRSDLVANVDRDLDAAGAKPGSSEG
jgi:tetratricopeptide (TPR) repeat protein